MSTHDKFDEAHYKPISEEEKHLLLKDFDLSIDDFFNKYMEYHHKVEYKVCVSDLLDVIIRVDKRKKYFQYFHGIDCNEGKIGALFAYWIAKFRPIVITDPKFIDVAGYNDVVNELFAVHYMISALRGMERIKLWNGHDGVDVQLDHPFIKDLCYDFRYRNISIDSIIVLADTITTETFKDTAVLPFTIESIDMNVEKSIGNFLLGITVKGLFKVKYIGRSDIDLQQRLKELQKNDEYTDFKFFYSPDPITAYKKECNDYHTFLNNTEFKLDNDTHPQKPKDAPDSLICPFCGSSD